MERKIQNFKTIFSIAVFVFILLGGGELQPAFGQLSAGDVAFTGFNGEGATSDDGFSVVLLSSVSGSQNIQFTSEEWNGSNFTGSGGSITWKAPAEEIAAGTVLVFTDVEDVPSVNIGKITDDTNMNLSGSGDIIYAFLGPDKDTPESPTKNSFLATIATGADLYNQSSGTEGTLDGTGLTQAGNETILLPDDIDNAEYIGSRSGNTPDGYLTLLNDIGDEDATDDNWDIYNGTDVAPFPSFNDQSFTFVSAPTIAFTAAQIDSSEGDGMANLTVKLVEANGTPVDVDVVFKSASSSADASDIENYTTKTVSFGSAASSGDTKTVTVNLKDDANFEGDEKVVFELQNDDNGSIIFPSTITLNIADNDAPDIVFNEINADPGDDANGDNGVDGNSDEFIEWVNNSGRDIDISGWTYADSNTDRFIFPDGAVISDGNAVVLFDNDGGSVQPSGNFGGALVFSDGEVGLNQSPEMLSLKDQNGNVIETATYNNNASGQSNNLSPEITGNSYEDHSTLSPGTPGTLSSPGTKVDGTAFGSRYAVGIRGSEGWRMIATPTKNTTITDLFGDFWMQGISGSDDPSGEGTIFSWNETGGAFAAPAGMGATMEAGKGYIVYVFNDDEFNKAGVQGGFPKIVNTDKTENSSPVEVQVTASDNDGGSGIDTRKDGWNLLGNPFGTDLSVTKLIDALEAADGSANANIQVWDNTAGSGQGAYVSRTDGERIAPFQAFWIRYEQPISPGSNTEVTLNRSNLAANTGTEFLKESNETDYELSISLHGNKFFDPFHIVFSDKGKLKLDRYDAYKRFSLNPHAINLYELKKGSKLLKDMLPKNLNKKVKIPLAFNADNRQKLRFEWDGLRNLPASWKVKLIDRKLNQKVDISKISEYSFTAKTKLDKSSNIDEEPLYQKTQGKNNGGRFLLSINPGILLSQEDKQESGSVHLNPNYPNPFNPSTTLSYELKIETDVTLTVWNMIGQKVATLVDGVKDAGAHKKTWNASQMPSGIYIARFEVEGKIYTRKMTLIK